MGLFDESVLHGRSCVKYIFASALDTIRGEELSAVNLVTATMNPSGMTQLTIDAETTITFATLNMMGADTVISMAAALIGAIIVDSGGAGSWLFPRRRRSSKRKAALDSTGRSSTSMP